MIDTQKIENGISRAKVKKLLSTRKMTVAWKFLESRKKGTKGIIMGYVLGHGGDLWLFKHDDGKEAVYSTAELELI